MCVCVCVCVFMVLSNFVQLNTEAVHTMGVSAKLVAAIAVSATAMNALAHSHSHGDSHGHAHGHGHSHGGKCNFVEIPDWLHELYDADKAQVIISASLLTSIVPIFIILLCPASPSKGVLHALLAFAAGSLLGDAMLHLLPHSMGGAPLLPEDSVVMQTLEAAHVSIPHLLFLVGFLGFMFLEKFLRLLQGGEGHGHSHSAPVAPTKGKGNKLLKSSAVLNLIADMTHNFTDGITIAAGFAHSLPAGVSTTLAVFVHEIPHEVGDYAVLVGSGLGKNGALLSQFATGFGNLAGALVMIYAEKLVAGAEQVVLPSMSTPVV